MKDPDTLDDVEVACDPQTRWYVCDLGRGVSIPAASLDAAHMIRQMMDDERAFTPEAIARVWRKGFAFSRDGAPSAPDKYCVWFEQLEWAMWNMQQRHVTARRVSEKTALLYNSRLGDKFLVHAVEEEL